MAHDADWEKIKELRERNAELLAMLKYIVVEHLADCYAECPYCQPAFALIHKAEGD